MMGDSWPQSVLKSQIKSNSQLPEVEYQQLAVLQGESGYSSLIPESTENNYFIDPTSLSQFVIDANQYHGIDL
ncbi:hypothetical protein ACFL3U_02180 [Pseudomonadota bacterium]